MADRDRLTDTLARATSALVRERTRRVAVVAHDRIAALEAEVERLRRERDEARVALRRALAAIPLHMRELRVQVATAAGLM